MKFLNSMLTRTPSPKTSSTHSTASQISKDKEREIIHAVTLLFCTRALAFTINFQSSHSIALTNIAYTFLHLVSVKLLYSRYSKLYSLIFNLIILTYVPIMLRLENGFFPAYCAAFSSSVFSLIILLKSTIGLA